jgi:hypothetical protein
MSKEFSLLKLPNIKIQKTGAVGIGYAEHHARF